MSEVTKSPASHTPSYSDSPDSDAFFSYAHRDRRGSTGIQAAPHQIGRRLGLWAVRAVHDDANLAVNPDLWGTAPKNPPTRRAVRCMSAMLSALAISLLACSFPTKSENAPLRSVPYATTAQVLEAVKAAEQVHTLSDNLVASLPHDDISVANGCF